jgi:hypothetical protein
MKSLVFYTLSLVLLSSAASADQMISLRAGSSMTLIPSVQTVVSCEGNSVRSTSCVCEYSAYPSRYYYLYILSVSLDGAFTRNVAASFGDQATCQATLDRMPLCR